MPAPEGTGRLLDPLAPSGPQALRGRLADPRASPAGSARSARRGRQLSTLAGHDGQPDEYVGPTIQASHLRETWLSFWTVSGPGTKPELGCTAEKGPFTRAPTTSHGYVAGQFVATEIDGYRTATASGSSPTGCSSTPRATPTTTRGCGARRRPRPSSRQSVANWYAILNGWHAGLDSVDPSLKAGLYANQYEYMTYKLYDQPLPTFIAGAFAEHVDARSSSCRRASRSGPNISGFIMFNTFTPTCAQVNNERLLLTEPPWDGDYNTVQIPAEGSTARPDRAEPPRAARRERGAVGCDRGRRPTRCRGPRTRRRGDRGRRTDGATTNGADGAGGADARGATGTGRDADGFDLRGIVKQFTAPMIESLDARLREQVEAHVDALLDAKGRRRGLGPSRHDRARDRGPVAVDRRARAAPRRPSSAPAPPTSSSSSARRARASD